MKCVMLSEVSYKISEVIWSCGVVSVMIVPYVCILCHDQSTDVCVKMCQCTMYYSHFALYLGTEVCTSRCLHNKSSS